MPLFTSLRQLPKQERAPAEEDLTADGSAAGRDGAVHDGTAEADSPGTGAGRSDGDGGAGGKDGWRQKHPGASVAVTRGTTALAALLVLAALVLPNAVSRLTPSAFARIPVEAILGAGILLALKARVRKVTAVVLGVALGLVTILKFLDMGFYQFLDRPFDLVLDWVLFDDLESFLEDSLGQFGAVAAVIGVLVLVVALVVFTALAVIRLSNILVRHNRITLRSVLVLGTVWISFAAFGVQVDDVPVASRSTTRLVHNRTHQVSDGLQDGKAFAKQARVDNFRDTPKDELLTGLRGKNVIFTFIESYGRSAVQDPRMAPHVSAVLEGLHRPPGRRRVLLQERLPDLAHLRRRQLAGPLDLHSRACGSRTSSATAPSPRATASPSPAPSGAPAPGGRWASCRASRSPGRRGSSTASTTSTTPSELGYKGPKFSWSPVPDQYSLAAFERLEHGKRSHKPLMAEIILASSHNPWAPHAAG